MYEKIPEELKSLPQWVGFFRTPAKDGKTTKKPVNVRTLYGASSTNPETWGTFEQAVNAIGKTAKVGESQGKIEGIGFVFAPPYCGIDLDHVINADTGEINRQALDVISTMDSYTEISPSGTGIHIIYKGEIHKEWKCKKNSGLGNGSDIEMYQQGRYFTVTGNRFNDKEIESRERHAALIYKAYMDTGQDGQKTLSDQSEPTKPKTKSLTLTDRDIIDKAMNSSSGMKFARLFNGDTSDYDNDDSRADMAFCLMLAFWCNKDISMMDRIFRQSRLMRDKWDEKHGRDTYGNITMQKAVESCMNTYSPTSLKDDDFSVNIENFRQKNHRNYSLDDTGNAERMSDMFGEVIRYNYTDKKWMLYDKIKWVYDQSGIIYDLVDKSLEAMKDEKDWYIQQDNENNDENQTMFKAWEKFYKKSRNHNTKNALEKEVQHYVPVTPNQLDRHKTLLNTPTGVIDLNDFEVRKAVPKDYFTKSVNANFDKSAKSPLWNEFLETIFDHDKDLIRYVQKAVGYSLTGSTAEQCAFFLYGTGRNGKSTFIDILRELFGDYARNIQPETIMIKNNNAVNSDIARLKGARFVTTVEPNEGLKLNEGLLKQLTGGDIITARKLYAEEFEFKAEFKLWMATNHKPIIRGTDLGIWRRVHMIPFTVVIPEDKVDRQLTDKLLKELDGIFLWALRGLAMYSKEGLNKPTAVQKAVDEYKKEMDVVSKFLDECTEKAFAKSVKASDLYKAYMEWCDTNTEYKMSNTKFGKEIVQRFEKIKKRDSYYYMGLQFIGEWSQKYDYHVNIGSGT